MVSTSNYPVALVSLSSHLNQTLHDYTHGVNGEVASVNHNLIEEAKISEEKDEYVTL